MEQIHDRKCHTADRDGGDPRLVSPPASQSCPLPHAQRPADALSDLAAGTRLAHRLQGSVDHPLDRAVRHALSPDPPNVAFRPSRGAPDEDGQLIGRNEVEGVSHAPGPDQPSLPDGGFNIGRPEVLDPCPQRHLRG
jgi:hypothetical protein